MKWNRKGLAPVMVLATAGLLALLGAGSWLIISIQKQAKLAKLELARTRAELQEKAKNLDLVEEERQKLSADYDNLKDRWTKTDDELRTVKTAAQRTQEELTAASSERAELQQRQAALQSEVEKVRKQVETETKERAALENQVKLAASAGLTRAELEQLSENAAKREEQSQELESRMEALSHAFEQLAWKHIELQDATGQNASAGPSPLMAEPPADSVAGGSAISKEQDKGAKRESMRLAKRYRHLGEFCLAAYQYDRAADAFEKSLSYHDDPDVHASLAFIYGRLLLSPEEAAMHTALASESKINAEHAFESINRSSGMPRRSRDVIWRWLANK